MRTVNDSRQGPLPRKKPRSTSAAVPLAAGFFTAFRDPRRRSMRHPTAPAQLGSKLLELERILARASGHAGYPRALPGGPGGGRLPRQRGDLGEDRLPASLLRSGQDLRLGPVQARAWHLCLSPRGRTGRSPSRHPTRAPHKLRPVKTCIGVGGSRRSVPSLEQGLPTRPVPSVLGTTGRAATISSAAGDGWRRRSHDRIVSVRAWS